MSPPAAAAAAAASAAAETPAAAFDAATVGWLFVQEYYTHLSREPARLHCFYAKDSAALHGAEAAPAQLCRGQADIHTRIAELGYAGARVRITNVDAQRSAGDSVLVMVVGDMLLDDSDAPRKFAQTFFLNASKAGSYYVLNDIMRFLDVSDVDKEDGDEEPKEEVKAAKKAPAPAAAPPAPAKPSSPVKAAPAAPEPAQVPPAQVPAPAPAAAPPAAKPKEEPPRAAPAAATSKPPPAAEKPAPAAAPAPLAAPPGEPAKPKTWASLAATASSSSYASASPATSAQTAAPAAPTPPAAAKPRRVERPPQQTTPPSSSEPYTVFVKHIKEGMTEAQVRECFAPFGSIKHIDVVPARNCAFVEYYSAEDGVKALHKSFEINGVVVTSEERRSRAPRPVKGGGSASAGGRRAFVK